VVAVGARVPAGSWQLPVGRAVRDCGAIVRAGWLAGQAIVLEGRRPVGPEGQVAHVCKPSSFSEYWMPIGLGNLKI